MSAQQTFALCLDCWETLPGSDGVYEVSNTGLIRSNFGRRQHLLKPTKAPSGYWYVTITGRGKQYVHRLVLEAFRGPCPEGWVCRHLDDNPDNNSLSNLVWGTESENMYDRVKNGIHHYANKTTCQRGHLLIEPNLRVSKLRKGWRECLSCHREQSAARSAHRAFDAEKADAGYYKLGFERSAA